MKRFLNAGWLLAAVLFVVASCNTGRDPKSNLEKYDPSSTYKLQLKPAVGAVYKYEITNETATDLTVNDKEVNMKNKAEMDIIYEISRDSSQNLVFTMTYDRIHLYTKNGDTETESDTNNGALAVNQTDKMLGILKKARIQATLGQSGEIIKITGYKEVGDEIMAGFAPGDPNIAVAQTQWEKVIGEGLIRKSMDQLFKIFPDSSVHLGDTWKLSSRQEGEFEMKLANSFTLKSVNDKIAIIHSEGKIISDNTSNTALGFHDVKTNLQGNQKGEFEMETETGMLIECKIKADIDGTVTVMGREIPVTINSLIKMKSRRLN